MYKGNLSKLMLWVLDPQTKQGNKNGLELKISFWKEWLAVMSSSYFLWEGGMEEADSSASVLVMEAFLQLRLIEYWYLIHSDKTRMAAEKRELW